MEMKAKKKLKAAVKVVIGSGRMASGAATAAGKGVLGSYARNHHMMHAARAYGIQTIRAGKKQVEEGMREWRAANND